ncbi:MAG: DNA methyltransferase [Hyphomonadaceae bacterium]|nr:DNA methyltransferase [Hyphomonadaceae bacterium]
MAKPPAENRFRKNRLQFTYQAIDDLKPDPKNPRQHSKKQIRQIANSIEAFGFNAPALVDGSLKVIGGHARIQAARLAGMTEVPTVCLDHLSEAQAQAYMIADNRLTENSVWDDQLLAITFKELSALELDFDLEDTGFEMGEIDFRIESLDQSPPDDEHLEDVQPLPGPAVTKPGDRWTLRDHVIVCANALEEQPYASLLGRDRATIVFTDPPYNVPIDGHVSGLGASKHREFAMASGEMTESQFVEFLTTFCRLLVQYSVSGSLHYIFMDWRHIGDLLAAGKVTYTELKNLCVWAKTNAGMGSLYRSQHELVAVFKSGRESHHNNIQLGRFGRHRSNLWTYAGMTSIARVTDEGALLETHPTVKPVRLVADAILDASARGDIVLDPFLGSGTTLIAAERVGRRARGIELDPAYIDVAIRRWQRETGEAAVHANSGRTFDEIAMVESNV